MEIRAEHPFKDPGIGAVKASDVNLSCSPSQKHQNACGDVTEKMEIKGDPIIKSLTKVCRLELDVTSSQLARISLVY